MIKQFLRNNLAHPDTRGLDLDDPRLTNLRRAIIKDKKFLNRLYQDWYKAILQNIPSNPGRVLELGTGAGFMKDLYPSIIQSEIFWLPYIHITLDGCNLPFADHTLKAIVMTEVLHHISRPRRFFIEACRCLRKDGVIAMIEPWFTPWSNWIYHNFHHEPFDHQAAEWEFPSTGPLSGANSALPWIIFERDKVDFNREFPQLSIYRIQPMMPIRYLISGGVSMRSLSPGWSYSFWKVCENLLNPWMDRLGMFALIVLKNK
jgi:SAM-dependent methyltransferase